MAAKQAKKTQRRTKTTRRKRASTKVTKAKVLKMLDDLPFPEGHKFWEALAGSVKESILDELNDQTVVQFVAYGATVLRGVDSYEGLF